MKKLIALLVIPLLTLSSCSVVKDTPPAVVEVTVEVATQNASFFAFKAVLRNNKDTADKLKADALVAVKAIRENILPILGGEPTGQVVVDTVNTVLGGLDIDISIKNIISSSIKIIITEVKLPENPTDQLDPKLKATIVGLFTGIANGLEGATK